MTDLKSMTLEEITAALRAMGEPSFRGKQVFTWLHRGITDFDEMMNIPKSLREKLRAEYYITAGRLPHGLQILRVHAGRQGEGLNTVGNARSGAFHAA